MYFWAFLPALVYKMKLIIWILVIVLTLTACGYSTAQDELSDCLGIDVSRGTLVHEEDDHGGFHGDGTIYVAIQFQDDAVEAEILENTRWKSLPLTDTLSTLIYGTTTVTQEGSVSIGPYLDVTIPEVNNGYYFFYDRQREIYEDSEVLNRTSFNYTIAIYDADTNQLYYCEYDT